MTQHVRDKEPETAVEPGRDRLLELLCLTLIAGATSEAAREAKR